MDEKTIILKEFLKQVRVNKFQTVLTLGMGAGLYFLYKKVDEFEKRLEGVATEERE